ncbi:MAG: hypothetical protein ACPLKP_03335 [Microgenomates group bacterium]
MIIILILIFWWSFSSPTFAFSPQNWEITVSATIGEPKLTVYGYTSPQALVELKGNRISELTIADATGYFQFNKVFLPPPKPHYPEICLTVVDRQSRVSSFPTCLPLLPPKLAEIRVGPVLLPPTLTLEKGEFLPGEQVKAVGATFPNSLVTIFLANSQNQNFSISEKIIPSAYAFFLPKYEIKSDENGNFEFNLPADKPNYWQAFATAEFQGFASPKSNSLSFKILGWQEWFWLKIKIFFLTILNFLRPYWWWVIIIGEIILLFLLFRQKKKSSWLMTSPPRQIIKKEKN